MIKMDYEGIAIFYVIVLVTANILFLAIDTSEISKDNPFYAPGEEGDYTTFEDMNAELEALKTEEQIDFSGNLITDGLIVVGQAFNAAVQALAWIFKIFFMWSNVVDRIAEGFGLGEPDTAGEYLVLAFKAPLMVLEVIGFLFIARRIRGLILGG